MKVVAISDLHGYLPKDLPECDLLLIAGDICPEINHAVWYQKWWLDTAFRWWLKEQKADKIIGVWGNHDFIGERPHEVPANLPWILLNDSGIEYKNFNIWGNAWNVYFHGWAFNLYENDIAKKWDLIPSDTDILVLHGPPHGYGDSLYAREWPDEQWPPTEHKGSKSLLEKIKKIRPKLTVFGHIHSGYGKYNLEECILANVALQNNKGGVLNLPMEFEL